MADPRVRDLTVALGKPLTLTAEEDTGLHLDDGYDTLQGNDGARWCLIGTVLIQRKYNLKAMENTLADVWRPVKGLHMRILGNNFFAFYFFHPVDMQRVLDAGPWRFANHVMVLKESQRGRQVTKEDLYEVPFWIQIRGLPPDRMTEVSGKRIGREIGRLIEVDVGDGHVRGMDFIRVRVFIDSRKPLRRGMRLMLKESPIWVSFQYERLPNFCYRCGMLDHVEKDCELGLEFEHSGEVECPYDDNLRAKPRVTQ
ncbi:hypothetical protein SLA2020_153740 [Shorea laevis]